MRAGHPASRPLNYLHSVPLSPLRLQHEAMNAVRVANTLATHTIATWGDERREKGCVRDTKSASNALIQAVSHNSMPRAFTALFEKM
jgi:hypothetical protein